MTTKEAIEFLLAQGLTKYRIAASISVAPVSINQYLKGTRMSEATAAEFNRVHGITITDVYVR